MPAIRDAERDIYAEVWHVPDYAKNSPGEQRVPQFLRMAGLDAGHQWTVLDAGAGSGKGAIALHAAGFDVRMCDLTPAGLVPEAQGFHFASACLWNDLKGQLWYMQGGTFDYIYCVDVLEHLPTQFVMLAVEQMLRISRKGLFLGVSLAADEFGVWVGRPLHHTVESFLWWKDSLAELGCVTHAVDMLDSAAFLLVRR